MAAIPAHCCRQRSKHSRGGLNCVRSCLRTHPRRDLLVRSVAWRDALVGSVALRLIIHFVSTGTISVPLRFRFSEGPACQVRSLEGPACQVRCVTLDNPSRFAGRDRHAPPNGHDKHAPPNGHNKRAPPILSTIKFANICTPAGKISPQLGGVVLPQMDFGW